MKDAIHYFEQKKEYVSEVLELFGKLLVTREMAHILTAAAERHP